MKLLPPYELYEHHRQILSAQGISEDECVLIWDLSHAIMVCRRANLLSEQHAALLMCIAGKAVSDATASRLEAQA